VDQGVVDGEAGKWGLQRDRLGGHVALGDDGRRRLVDGDDVAGREGAGVVDGDRGATRVDGGDVR
jgi:hypothetical protein